MPLEEPRFWEAAVCKLGDRRGAGVSVKKLVRVFSRGRSGELPLPPALGGEALRARISSLIKEAHLLQGLLSPAARLGFFCCPGCSVNPFGGQQGRMAQRHQSASQRKGKKLFPVVFALRFAVFSAR